MRNFSWLREGMRVVFKTEPFDIWRTGAIKTLVASEQIALVIRDSSNRYNSDLSHVKYVNIVGEATERITHFPFYWGNVLEHLTEEAKENL